ncbi:dipicolinic acid synthetase subunit A [Bacillaceae bacterium SIJ1]|uniref:dipicolinic acid synthetase subunit A n=1 Tax=Litoribacterium kuwaitense TaxID=1398745 RepID=UPI0013EE3345|nr:dipicolinic acid synthetase subunit A [Litoribacterium kuwaitense]NGP44080.1 dipicolinic acid synthetase subunit A [Litoribacterium kuwaitense]
MSAGKHIALYGGDARQLEVVRRLHENGCRMSLFGYDQLDVTLAGATKRDIKEFSLSDVDAIILPVSGLQKDGTVETIFSDGPLTLTKEHIEQTPNHCQVFTGIASEKLKTLCKEAGRQLVPLFDRDDVAIYNSIPTAEGTVMMVIQHTDQTIHSAKVAVLGWGRTGITVARTFRSLGADVRCAARSSAHLARIEESGHKPFHIDDRAAYLQDVDVCINTIPSLILSKDVLDSMPENVLIVDLASKPGGTDFKYAEEKGIKALLAPGLPGIVAPKTAGQILAKVLSQLLEPKPPVKGEERL